MSGAVNEGNVGGYSVAYSRDDTYFPVYVTAALAFIFLTTAWITGAAYWLPLAVAAAGFTYYNIPLLETGRPTIGANQYGIFLQAFGLIRWRAIERGHDTRKQSGSKHSMAFARPVNKIKCIITQWNLLVVDNHLDGTSPQPARHFCNVGRALLQGAEETQIIAPRLYDYDVGSIRHIPVDAAEHHRCGLKRHSGIGDTSVGAPGSKQVLQLRGICSLVADVPAMGIAGADRYDSHRRGIGGHACAHGH